MYLLLLLPASQIRRFAEASTHSLDESDSLAVAIG